MNIREYINIVEQLNEAGRALLYHGTGFSAAVTILRYGKIEASENRVDGDDHGYGYYNVSLTRDPGLRYYQSDGEDFAGSGPIVFVINQDALRHRTKTQPFDYHNTGSRGAEEAEEQALTREIDIEQCVVEIRLYSVPKGFAPSMDDLYQMGFDDNTSEAKFTREGPARMNAIYQEIAELARGHRIVVTDLRRKGPKTIMRKHVQANIDNLKK
jgi:hypothetical protein